MSRTKKTSKYISLYEQIRDAIVAGEYKAGTKLPSKRYMAEERGMSTITVEHAYELLAEEGYIAPVEKKGYFVVFDDRDTFPVSKREPRSSGWSPAHPASDFPYTLYAKTVRRVLSDYGEELMQKSPGFGTFILRDAIASYLKRSRNINTCSDRIIIGSGAEYLYGMAVKVLGRDKKYGIEDPSYKQIARVYRAEGVEILPLKLEHNGIRSSDLEQTEAEVLHITPYRSYPSGVSATAAKKAEYLKWRKQRNGYIIEDDAESEFSPSRKPEETLFALAKGEGVIYVNTFTRTIGGFLRIAYMVIPEAVEETFKEKTGFLACSVPVPDQYILAELINSGAFERHINRVRRALRKESGKNYK